MNSSTVRKWQYSLRSLLLLTVAVAVLAAAGRIFWRDTPEWTAFVALSAMPLLMLAGASKRAYLVAWLAVYAPFVVMATYTYFFVACSHCKEAAWAVLPYAPGMIPFELAHHWFDMPRLYGLIAQGAGLSFSVVVVALLTPMVYYRGVWLRTLSVVVTLLVFSFCAFVVLSLIRA
jgi:hypothetical protein